MKDVKLYLFPAFCGVILVLIMCCSLENRRYRNNTALKSYLDSLCSNHPESGSKPLPKDLAGLSVDGYCYVTVPKRGGLVLVHFPISEWYDGYLYANRPLRDDDYRYGSVAPTIDINTRPGPMPESILEDYHDNWYRVNYED